MPHSDHIIEERLLPRRYIVDQSGTRVLIGLSVEETAEFQKATSTPSNPLGENHQRERWFALYEKHERSWKEWVSSSRGCRAER